MGSELVSGLEILAGHTIEEGRAVVLLLSDGTPLPGLSFPDVADAKAFIIWASESHGWMWDEREQSRLGELWGRERAWPPCGAHDHPEHPCVGRARPGAWLCESCEGDEDFAAEMAARRGATE